MTVFHCDGFETYGNKSTAGATVQTRISATDSGGDGSTTFQSVSGGHGGDVSIIDDFETVGFALQFPDLDAARSEWMNYEWPDGTGRFADYKLPTDGSVPTFVTGFRVYNAATTPAQQSTIWQNLTSLTGAGGSLSVASNNVDLIFTPTSGAATTIVGALTADTWHYIEIEFKPAPAANGGFVTIDVDGSEVADLASQNLAAFTFFNTFGVRIGVSAATNQTGGDNWAFDDVYQLEVDGVDHTGPLGPQRVLLLTPNSDATPNDWTPDSGGNNFSRVTGQDWDTATYVEAVTTGDDDHYGLSTLASVDAVNGCQIDVVCDNTDGTPNLHIGFDDGTADEEDMGVISAQEQKRMMFEVDPSGAQWTVSNVNSAEATQRMTE